MSNNIGTPFAEAARADPASASGKYTFGHDPGVTSVHAIRKAATEAPHLLRNLPTLLKSLAAGSSSSDAPKIKVLDVGCGPGSITVDLISYLPAGSHITGIEPPFADESSGILSQARAHADEVLGRERSAAQLEFKRADVYKLDKVFEEGSFDVVHAHQVLFHLHNPIKAIEQMWRVLKKGGILSLREGDWDTLAAFPPVPKAVALHRAIYVVNGASVQAGRQLHSWVRRATGGASTEHTYLSLGQMLYCQANRDGRADMWAASCRTRLSLESTRADAVSSESDGKQGLFATRAEADAAFDEAIAEWQQWVRDPDAYFALSNGELITFKP